MLAISIKLWRLNEMMHVCSSGHTPLTLRTGSHREEEKDAAKASWERRGRELGKNQMGRSAGHEGTGMSGPPSSEGSFKEKLKTAKSRGPFSTECHVLIEAKVTRFPDGSLDLMGCVKWGASAGSSQSQMSM